MAEARDVKIEFSEESLEALERFKGAVEDARNRVGLLSHDEQLRLAAISEAIKMKSGYSPHQLPSTAGVIESYVRYGRVKDIEGFTTLGPECFIGNEGNTISFQGDNFYRGCGNFVFRLPGGGSTHCVKRVGHPSEECEDYDGRTYNKEVS